MTSGTDAIDASSAGALLRPSADPGGPRGRAWLWRLAAAAVLIALVWWLRDVYFADLSHPRGRTQRIALLNPPKPPPKPPEKPPEPPPLEKQPQVQVAAPGPRDDAPAAAAADALGVDSLAEGAGDSFGLVARRGGRDITTIGGPDAGGGGDRFVFQTYAGTVLQRLRRELLGKAELLGRDYVAVVDLWIDPRGNIVRAELPQGSGLASIDSALRDAFAAVGALPTPPSALPQPLRFRVAAKDLDGSAR